MKLKSVKEPPLLSLPGQERIWTPPPEAVSGAWTKIDGLEKESRWWAVAWYLEAMKAGGVDVSDFVRKRGSRLVSLYDEWAKPGQYGDLARVAVSLKALGLHQQSKVDEADGLMRWAAMDAGGQYGKFLEYASAMVSLGIDPEGYKRYAKSREPQIRKAFDEKIKETGATSAAQMASCMKTLGLDVSDYVREHGDGLWNSLWEVAAQKDWLTFFLGTKIIRQLGLLKPANNDEGPEMPAIKRAGGGP